MTSEESTQAEGPLGPVATMPVTAFGAREGALAGMASDSSLTWHITCSSITFRTEGSDG